MQPQPITNPAPTPLESGSPPIAKSYRMPSQPLDVINVPGAHLKLGTLSAISGRSMATLYRDAASGQLKLLKQGKRCTRVTSEDARAFLELLAKGAA